MGVVDHVGRSKGSRRVAIHSPCHRDGGTAHVGGGTGQCGIIRKSVSDRAVDRPGRLVASEGYRHGGGRPRGNVGDGPQSHLSAVDGIPRHVHVVARRIGGDELGRA